MWGRFAAGKGNMKSRKRMIAAGLSVLVSLAFAVTLPAAGMHVSAAEAENGATEKTGEQKDNAGESVKTVTLRICNWEEYIDTGDWDESETIDLPSGDIIGENSMIDDFEQWYEKTCGIKVRVEYSTFGTNEDLYNMLTLGDTYDLVCPSEYMFMKLMSENKLVPLSEHFYDETDENNYYVRGVSPYLRNIFETSEYDGEKWAKYAAGYMWGTTGFVYNPEVITKEEASTFRLVSNPAYRRRITIKDNVRDSYFMAVAALNHDLLVSDEFRSDPGYHMNLENLMNNTSADEIAKVQDYLQDVKDNVYSFETDSGKADMITGKVVANYQWSGDAAYTMDQAEEDGYFLDYAVPEETTNIYFDGWVMLKSGIGGNAAKQQAAEAFINFISRPDNVVRNMYYIGYTSVISGGRDPRVQEYLKWNYEAEEDDDTAVPYDLTYYFTGDTEHSDPDYIMMVPEEQLDRQLSAQYPSVDVIRRASIMRCFAPDQNAQINRMWVNVRCYNVQKMPVWGRCLTALGILAIILMIIRKVKIMRKRSEQRGAKEAKKAIAEAKKF